MTAGPDAKREKEPVSCKGNVVRGVYRGKASTLVGWKAFAKSGPVWPLPPAYAAPAAAASS